MAKEVKKITYDPFQEDSSLFSTDFASEGLTWIKGFYQKLETSCNVYADTCNKYVTTAGEHIKKIYDEVFEWENPHDDNRPDYDLCSKQNSVTKESYESSVKLQKSSSKDKISDCNQMQSAASVLEVSDLLPLCSKCKGKPVSIEGSGENCMESTDAGECFQLPAEVNDMFKETITLAESPRNENKPIIEPKKSDAFLQVDENVTFVGADCKEIADGREEFTSSTSNVLGHSLEVEGFETIKIDNVLSHSLEVEGFETIKIDDCWFDAELSRGAGKNSSFKKKLKNVFMPRNVHNLAYNGSTSEMQNNISSSASSVVPTNGDLYLQDSTQDILELEWEISGRQAGK